MERVEQRYGPRSKVTGVVAGQLRSWILQQPDLTLAELQQRLWEKQRLAISIGRLWGVLRELRLPLKKVAPRPRAGHPGSPAAPPGVAGASKPDRSGRAGVSGCKRRDHGNDAAVGAPSAGRASPRRRTLTLLGAMTTRGLL